MLGSGSHPQAGRGPPSYGGTGPYRPPRCGFASAHTEHYFVVVGSILPFAFSPTGHGQCAVPGKGVEGLEFRVLGCTHTLIHYGAPPYPSKRSLQDKPEPKPSAPFGEGRASISASSLDSETFLSKLSLLLYY